jgi:hypothetical protein
MSCRELGQALVGGAQGCVLAKRAGIWMPHLLANSASLKTILSR